MSYFLTLEDIKNVCYEYAKTHLAFNEPIPSFDSRYPDKLETALNAPQQTVFGKPAYPTLPAQAAVFFYEMIKLHPFLNGNKRIACVSLMTFLLLNNQWLRIHWKKFYNIAVTVAVSKPENRESIVKLLAELIKDNTKNI